MRLRPRFRLFLLFGCILVCSASTAQTTPRKPRVFVSDQPVRAGQHLDHKPTESIDAKRTQPITETCQTVAVTTIPDDADYFLLWSRGGFQDSFALYDRQGRMIVHGSTDEPERGRGRRIAQALCRFVNKTEKSRNGGFHQVGG